MGRFRSTRFGGLVTVMSHEVVVFIAHQQWIRAGQWEILSAAFNPTFRNQDINLQLCIQSSF